MKQPRNAPCACGSGKKFKHCHGGPDAAKKTTPAKVAGTLVAAAIAGLLTWSIATMVVEFVNGDLVPNDGRVWSAEHGHWHDANGQELGAAAAAGPNDPAPPGKVWSPEHNHWH